MVEEYLTLGCHVPWLYTTLFLLLGAQTVSDFTSTTSHSIAGIFCEITSLCDYGCTCSTYTQVDWAWIKTWAPGYSGCPHWLSGNYEFYVTKFYHITYHKTHSFQSCASYFRRNTILKLITQYINLKQPVVIHS